MKFDLCPGDFLSCIPTKEGKRNRHLNRLTNIWSVFVFIGLAIGVAGGAMMYLSTKGIVVEQLQVIENHLELMVRLEAGEASPQEALDLIDGLPKELKAIFLEETGVNMNTVKQAYTEGYIAMCEPTSSEVRCECLDYDNCDAEVSADKIELTPGSCKWVDKMPGIIEAGTIDLFELMAGNTCGLSDEEKQAIEMMNQLNSGDLNLDDIDLGDQDHDHEDHEEVNATDAGAGDNTCDFKDPSSAFAQKEQNADFCSNLTNEADCNGKNRCTWLGSRRRRLGEVPRPEDIAQLRDFADTGSIIVAATGLIGPILTTIGMVFFCCMLKALSDNEENKLESFCGSLMGCLVFPVLFILGTVLSIIAAVFMNVMCIVLTKPFAVLLLIKNLRECGQAGSCSGMSEKDLAEWKAELEANPLNNLSSLGTDHIWPLMQDALKVALPRAAGGISMCDDPRWTCVDDDGNNVFDEFDSEELCNDEGHDWEQDGSYLMRDVLDKDTAHLCKDWTFSYQFGTASQIIAAVFSLFGVFIALFVGYKACCANGRNKNSGQHKSVLVEITGAKNDAAAAK